MMIGAKKRGKFKSNEKRLPCIKNVTINCSLSLSLSLSLLLAVVFATSLFLLPRHSIASTTNDDAIVLKGDTVIIQGNCDTKQIHSFMNNQGAQAKEVHFANTIVIQTLQTWEQLEAGDISALPFAYLNKLEKVSADSNSKVLFMGADSSTNPTLMCFFGGCPNLKSVEGLAAWNVSNVTGERSMLYLFAECSNLTSLEGLSTWDVSHLTGAECLRYAFQGCSALTSLDALSTWDVSQVTGDACMYETFFRCTSLTSLDGLSAWDVGNVNGEDCMSGMFRGCTNLTSLDGLSAWDVSGVNGGYCMSSMFEDCSSLTSLDGLSAWDVSRVNGEGCMNSMFEDCYNIQSIDGLASWDIQKALASTDGVHGMFSKSSGATNPMSISSITVSDTFTLTDDMFKESSSDPLPTWYWWPVNAASPAAVAMAGFVAATQDTANNGYRWQRCVDGTSTNPMKDIASADAVSISWGSSQTTLVYTGLLQSVSPVVTIQGETEPLELGRDFYVVYTKAQETKESPAIKDVGSYSAQVILRGRYNYTSASELASQSITIQALALDGTVYAPFVYTLPNTFKYTGKEIEPKTMVRLYLRDDPNPGSTPEKPLPDIPIYTYLIQNTAERNKGDYSVSYANNINSGEANATVQGVTPAGLPSSNLEGTATAYFTITGGCTVTFDTNGGSAVEPKEVAAGHPVTKPEDPTRDGYTFLYWCIDSALTEEFNFATPITADITLYAKWEVAPEPGPDPTPGTQDGWVQSDAGWQYVLNGEYLNDGWHYIIDQYGEHWYFFDADTYIATSRWIWDDNWEGWYWVCSTGPMIENLWQWIDNAWYGFWWGGKMCQGWVWDTSDIAWYYCDDYTGRVACNEWAWDGAWYYFDQNCHMLSNCWVGDYWLNEHGMWV